MKKESIGIAWSGNVEVEEQQLEKNLRETSTN